MVTARQRVVCGIAACRQGGVEVPGAVVRICDVVRVSIVHVKLEAEQNGASIGLYSIAEMCISHRLCGEVKRGCLERKNR